MDNVYDISDRASNGYDMDLNGALDLFVLVSGTRPFRNTSLDIRRDLLEKLPDALGAVQRSSVKEMRGLKKGFVLAGLHAYVKHLSNKEVPITTDDMAAIEAAANSYLLPNIEMSYFLRLKEFCDKIGITFTVLTDTEESGEEL